MLTFYCSTVYTAEESTQLLYVRQNEKGSLLKVSLQTWSLEGTAASGCLHWALTGTPSPRPWWGPTLHSLHEPVEDSGLYQQSPDLKFDELAIPTMLRARPVLLKENLYCCSSSSRH